MKKLLFSPTTLDIEDFNKLKRIADCSAFLNLHNANYKLHVGTNTTKLELLFSVRSDNLKELVNLAFDVMILFQIKYVTFLTGNYLENFDFSDVGYLIKNNYAEDIFFNFFDTKKKYVKDRPPSGVYELEQGTPWLTSEYGISSYKYTFDVNSIYS